MTPAEITRAAAAVRRKLDELERPNVALVPDVVCRRCGRRVRMLYRDGRYRYVCTRGHVDDLARPRKTATPTARATP